MAEGLGVGVHVGGGGDVGAHRAAHGQAELLPVEPATFRVPHLSARVPISAVTGNVESWRPKRRSLENSPLAPMKQNPRT